MISLSQEIKKALDEINFLAPWLSLALPEKYKSLEVFNSIPTLEQFTRMDKEMTPELEELQKKATIKKRTQC